MNIPDFLDSETNPPAAFYFQVELDDQNYSFNEVSGLSLRIDTEQITEGGENRFKFKVPAAVKYSNLEFKRGLVPKGSHFFQWVHNALTSGFDRPLTTKSLVISLLNEEGNKTMSWTFDGVYPVGWTIAPLNSMNNEILIEAVSFSYNSFERIR